MTTTLTLEAVEKQRAAALWAHKVFRQSASSIRKTPAKGAMLPRVWDLDTLLRSVSSLAALQKMLKAGTIYIRAGRRT